ncbi:MAG: hypothetical protein HC785_11565 [Calothrix sp. CSU_2_0]|nr:hypothetical protein [Calothrix sp. CSU_2_0]
MIPPPIIAPQTINLPAYADLRQQELSRRIVSGTSTVTFNIAQNPIRNANDWNSKFPGGGTLANPTVVRVTGGGLEIPNGITLNNYIITVDSGDITFKGNNHTLNNVMLVASIGSIDLARSQGNNVAAFASNSVNMAGNARFEGTTTIANGSSTGSITFNGASKNLNSSNKMQVVSQGSLTFSGASDTRGTFISGGDFTFNGNSTLYGTIGAKGNITFNGQTTVIYAGDTTPDSIAPTISASLERDTAANNTTNIDKITSDPTIIGSVLDNSTIAEFKAGFNNTLTANFTNVLAQRNADGSFRFTRSQLEAIYGSTLPDGVHTLKLQATDSSGNATSVYEFTFTLDTTEPAPNNLDLTAATDSGTSNTDNLTNRTNPTITGNANPGANVQLTNNNQVIGNAIADSNGNWQITGSNLVNGTYILTATATDIAGNTSAASQPLQITIDTVAPNPPVFRITAATDTGESNSDGITNNNTPVITGTAEANSQVELYKDGQLVGTTNASANGAWQIQLAVLTNGNHTFTATTTDAAGNTSSPSSAYTITIDTQINPPSNLDLMGSSDSGTSDTDNITKSTTPTITGNADANNQIQLFNGIQLVGQTTANSDGKWQITPSELTAGTYNLSAVASDIAGNTSTPSTPLQIVIDSLLPQLTLTTPIDTQPLQQGARLVGSVDGTGSPIVGLSYRFDDLPEINLPVTFGGLFDTTIDFTGISNGSYRLTITAIDTAGNTKIDRYNVFVGVDTAAPAITANLQRDTAANNTTNTDKITFDPRISGTVIDASNVVEFKAGFNNTPVANFTDVLSYRNSDGSFALDVAALNVIYGGNLPDGLHTLKLIAKDNLGNTSPTYEFTFTLDTTTPVPSLNLTTVSDTGISNQDKITNDSTPTIAGTGEIGATIQLFNGSQELGQAVVDGNGTWQITTSELTDGVQLLNATVTDIAGNTTTSAALAVTLDTLLPQLTLTTPLESLPLEPGSKLTGSVNGTGTAIASFTYRFNNFAEKLISFNSAGTFEQNFDFTGLSDGNYTLIITATDTAGNVTAQQYNVTVNATPAVSTITASLANDTASNNTTNTDKITFDPSIVGNIANAATVVEFKAGFNNTLPANFVDVFAQLNSDGSFSFNRSQLEAIYGSTLPDGANTLRLFATDISGNISSIFSFTFTLDTTTNVPTFNLDPVSDSGTVGDNRTKFDTVTLAGLAEPGAILQIEGTTKTVTADNTGKYSFADIALNPGDNQFIVKAIDIAGNQRTYSTAIYRFSAPTAINLSNNIVAENSTVGKVIGEFSSIDSDLGDTHTYTLVDNAGGRFQIVDNKLQVANGTLLNFEANSQHNVIVRSTDKNGLSKEETIAIALSNINEAPIFTSTPNNTTIEAGNPFTYNITTTDPDAGDTRIISATGLPTWLTFTDNGNGTATITGTPNNSQLGLFNIVLTATDAAGLKSNQNIIIGSQITLAEQTNFNSERSFPLVIPNTPSILRFKIDPIFDNIDLDSINDAFEVALVDASGNAIVHTINKGRDAFFNLTEGENPVFASGTTYDAATKTVSLNLTGVSPQTATLIFRLVNDDSDTTTNVKITDFALVAAPTGTTAPTQTIFAPEISGTAAPNFNLLTDVSNSLVAEYSRTSFNKNSKTLYADIIVRNAGSYSVDVPLLVAVNNISDPSIILRNPDGVTPDGIPYYDFTSLVVGGKLNPNGESASRAIAFYNPSGVQFTYDVVVLAQLNIKPVIESKPVIEIIGGQEYRYQVKASDKNGDILSYKLLVSPNGMGINSETGLISWNTTASNKGNQSVVVEVSDSRGGVETQVFDLAVIDTPPNRPPVFTTNPVVDAAINTEYKYDADAVDPDRDDLTYNLVLGPDGMTVDQTTGEVTWTPTYENTFGDTILGKINNPGERYIYKFGMVEGQSIYFDPLKFAGDANYWRVEIISPSGRKLVDASGNHSGPLNLTETGNYQLIISTYSGITGDYGFKLLDLDTIPVAQFDTNITDTINPGTEDRLYRFNGNQGQRLYLDTLSTQTRLDWVLYRADNQVAISQSWSDIELELPSTGEYILALRGSAAFNSSVGYTFRIVTPDTNIVELTGFGSQANPNTQTGSISEKGEQDIYTFTGSKGQRLYFDVLDVIAERYGIEATLISPSGKEYFKHSMSEGDVNLRTLEEDGNYRLIIDGLSENTGSYAFNLLDATLATSINLDTEIEGTLNPGKETHLYQFIATADSRLSFDSLLNIPGTWTLYGPGNQIITGSGVGLNSYFETEEPLPVTGTYILAIQGAGTDAIDYKFKVITPETQSGGLIFFDTPVSAQITEKGERDIYTINGNAGARVFLDTLIDNSQIRFTLTSPNGEKLINRDLYLDRFYDPIILPESGTYQLVVDGNEATSESDYSFQLLSSDNAETLTVNATQSTSGTLDPGSSAKLYQINGIKGERIYLDSQIDVSQTNGSGVFILYSPGNQLLISSYTNQDFEYELPSTGTYYLMVRGDGEIPLDYQIQLISTSVSPAPVSRNLNDVVAGVGISQLGEQDIYTYNVTTVGTRVYFDGRGSNSNIIARLINPSGVEVWSGNTASDGEPITLLETGIYRLIVDGSLDATGNYGFRLANLATSATSLTLGSAVTGNLAAGETRFYSINGILGQSLKFDNLAITANGEWVLYAPGKLFNGGTTVSSASLSQDFEVTLPASGIYVLALRNNSDTSTNFNFRVDNLGAATGSNNSILSEPPGFVSPTTTHIKTFNATAGTYIYFDNRIALTGSTNIRLIHQNADVYDFRIDTPIQLTKSGPYTIRIEGEGNYDYQLINFAVPSSTTQLNFDSTQTNAKTTNFSTGYATQVYRFTATVGQKLFYDALDSNASNATAVQIISPSGDRIFNNFATANSELLAIAETGTYYVVISNNTESIENVSFRLLNASSTNGSTIISNFSNPISGEFDAAEQRSNLYRFNISNSLANQPFYFNVESGNSSRNSWTLYAPGGSIVTDGNGSFNDLEITPPRAGEYVLAVRGNGEASSYQFSIIPLTQSPVAKNIGDEISGSISLPGEKDIYTINVTNPQQRIYIDGITDSSAGNIKVSLISPSGIKVVDALDMAGNQQLFALDEVGEYRLVVDAKDDYTGDYSLRLIDTSNAIPLEFSQVTTQTIPNNQTVLYKFEATAGKYFYLKSDITAGDKSVWTLYSSGRQVISTNLSFNAENDSKVILPIDGTYILALEGYGADGTTYELELVEPEVAPAQVIQIGDIVVNPDSSLKNIEKPGEKDTYTFTGSIGQNLLFDSIIGTSGLNVEIFSPSGQKIYSEESTVQEAPFTLIEGGDYQIVISGNGRSVGDYQFRLFDLEQAAKIDLNTTSTVTLDRASEAKVYKITGSKGQNLYFDSIGDFQTDTAYTGWTLYSSVNQVVASGNSRFGRPDLDVLLPGDGTYTLVFDSDNNNINTETYDFQIIATEVAAKELTFGETFSGTLEQPGDTHSYTFNGQVGERLFFDSLLGNSAIFVKLYSPSSPNDTIQLFSTADDSGKPFFLQETGEYRLVIDPDYETVGDYSFRLVDIEDTEVAEQLKLNTNYNKTIETQGQIDFYQFQAQKGDKLYFNLQDGDETNVTWSIFGPDNEILAGIGNVYPDLEIKAEYAGKYVLAVKSQDGSPASYNFQVSAPVATAKTLELGTIESGSISKPGEQYEYTFTATAGQRIFFDTLADNDKVSIKLIGPGNVDITSFRGDSDASAPVTLTENGTYRLVVDTSFDATGDYSFRLLDAGQTKLTFDEEQSGSLNSRETALYQISGKVGDRITFDIPSGSWEGLEWTLYGIDGAILGYPGFNSNSLSWMLPATGSYTLALRNLTANTDAEAIDYSFDVSKEAPTPVTLAGFGTVQTGAIASGQVATHTFSATAGTRVYFDSLDSGYDEIYFEIVAPDNTVIHSSSMNSDFTIAQLQKSGTYTLRIQGNDATSVGDYKYRLLELPNQTPDPRDNENSLELGGQIAKTLNGYETEVFSFTGTVGQKIFYDGIIPTDNNGYIGAILVSPSGRTALDLNQWSVNALSDTGLYTLSETGTYNLLVLNPQDTPTGVRFRVLDAKDAEILQPNRLVAGNLQPGSATNLYKLSGKAEQRLYLDAISGDGISWSLYNSETGQVVAGPSSMNDLEATIPTDGEYILAINGTSSDAVSYSFQVVSFPDATAIITPGNGESTSVGDGLGSYRVVLETSDSKGGTAEQSFMVRVGPEPGNNAPVIATDAIADGFANRFYRYDVDANDADGDRLTYSLAEAPGGMFIDSQTGKITWITPVVGIQTVKIRVTDGRGGVETQTFDLNIADDEFGTIRGAVFSIKMLMANGWSPTPAISLLIVE